MDKDKYQFVCKRLLDAATKKPRDSDDYFHEVDYDCSGRHCKLRMDLSRDDTRGVFWALVNQGILRYSLDAKVSKCD